MNNNSNAIAITSMVLGIVSCLCFCLSFSYFLPPVGLVAGIVGLVLSVTARKTDPSDTFATAGLVLSIIGLVLCAVTTVTCTVCYGCTACSVCHAARSAAYYW